MSEKHHCRQCMGTCELIGAAYQRGLAAATLPTTPSDAAMRAAEEPTYDQILQAITDIQEARESHVQWAAHLRDTKREDCKGCDDHAAHIGDAAYHDEWIAKYDNVIYVLARAPFTAAATTSPETPVGGFTCACCQRNMELRINGKFCNECATFHAAPVAATADNEGEE